MAIMSATRADVFSNARVKLYPSTQVLQVANESIFRAAGWEARTREYDVPPKGQGKTPSVLWRSAVPVQELPFVI